MIVEKICTVPSTTSRQEHMNGLDKSVVIKWSFIVRDSETGERFLQLSPTEAKKIYDYRNPEHQKIVAGLLAKGEIGLWHLSTPGIIGDATSLRVARAIQEMKGQANEPLRGNVITLPWNRLREYVNVARHSTEIQAILRNPRKMLPKAGAIFYHLYAGKALEGKSHITKLSPQGYQTAMVFPYDDPYLLALHDKAAQNAGVRTFVLQGTSANLNGQIQPQRLEEVSLDILRDPRIKFIIDCSKGMTDSSFHGQLEMVDLTGEYDYTTMRRGVFPPPPNVQGVLNELREGRIFY